MSNLPCRVAQSVARLIQGAEVPGSIPGPAHNLVFPSADSRRAVVSYWRKYVYSVPHRRSKSRKETPQKLTQLSSRSHPRHLVGKRTAQKDITIDTTSDSQVNSHFQGKSLPRKSVVRF